MTTTIGSLSCSLNDLQQHLKQQITANNLSAVTTFNEYLNALLSIHKQSVQPVNWDELRVLPKPKLPYKKNEKQFEAEYNYQTYEPSFLDFVLLKNRKKLNYLLDQIELGLEADKAIYNADLKEFKKDALHWRTLQTISNGIRETDPIAYQHAVGYLDPFKAIAQLGTAVKCEFFSTYVTINLYVNITDTVPDYVLGKTEDDKLSITQMDGLKFNQRCQQYICGCALRAAKETFAVLPVNFVLVNAIGNTLDHISDNVENKSMISVKFDRENMNKLDFETLDCLLAVTSFPHNLEFTGNTRPL